MTNAGDNETRSISAGASPGELAIKFVNFPTYLLYKSQVTARAVL